MLIHIQTDSRQASAELSDLLTPRHAVISAPLSATPPLDCQAIVVAADLRKVDNIPIVRDALNQPKNARYRIFVTDRKERLFAARAYALGATHVFVTPIDKRALLFTLADDTLAGSLQTTFDPQQAEDDATRAAFGGAAALASMFTAVMTGKQIDVAGARSAAGAIADSVAEDGLSNWLATVRRHHEGTYQHCLLVTGVAVDFGLSLGLPRAEIERLHSAAMFHDIGKARIPLTILDKPGRLDPNERALIETHPVAGYEILKNTPGISAEILDAVRHHHEYLDGSGYPDGRCEEGISDLVRVLTIADIFAALIEDRRYKPSMPREEAYQILCGMRGKLEAPLLRAFKDVALVR